MSVVTTRTPTTACPTCRTKVSAATSPWGKVPKPGDMSVCAKCLTVNRFTNDLALTAMSDQEWLTLDSDIRAEVAEVRAMLSGGRRVPSPRPAALCGGSEVFISELKVGHPFYCPDCCSDDDVQKRTNEVSLGPSVTWKTPQVSSGIAMQFHGAPNVTTRIVEENGFLNVRIEAKP